MRFVVLDDFNGNVRLPAGAVVDDAVQDTAAMESAGALLAPIVDPDVSAAAARYLNQRGTGNQAVVPFGSMLGSALRSRGGASLILTLSGISVEDALGTGGVPPTRTLTAGAGLTGGGDLSADRTFDVGAGTGITVNPNDVAVNVGALLHDSLGGLPGADAHTQYLLLAGRAGGQAAFGGLAAADDLDLAANTVGTGAGRININSPVVFGSYSATTAAYGFSYTATEVFAAAFVGGGLNFSGTISFTDPTMIYESFRGAPTITSAVAPTFNAYTVLQALPILVAGSGAGENPLPPLVLNAGPQVRNDFAGTRTVSTMAAVNWSGQVRSTISAGVMRATTHTGLRTAPSYSCVVGGTIDFGTIRGLWAQVPSVTFLGSNAGTRQMTAYYAVDVDPIGTFDGTAPVAAVRSAITPAAGQSFLINLGGADSDMGDGALLSCGTVQIAGDGPATLLSLGAADDAEIYYDGTDLIIDPQAVGFGQVFVPGRFGCSHTVFPAFQTERVTAATNLIASGFRFVSTSTGDMVDGFGGAWFFAIQDDAAVINSIVSIAAERAGADNTGRLIASVFTAGVSGEVLSATAVGMVLMQGGGTVRTGGGRIANTTRITSAASPYTVLASDDIIIVDTDGGAVAVDLPAGVDGTHYKVANVGSSGNDVTLDPNGTEQIWGQGAGVAVTLIDGDIIDLNFEPTEGWW